MQDLRQALGPTVAARMAAVSNGLRVGTCRTATSTWSASRRAAACRARIVIRPGCYLTHDDGALHAQSPMGANPRTEEGERLEPAFEVWGAVLSRPEPTRVIVGLGKRDVSTDGLLPVVKKVRPAGTGRVEERTGPRVAVVNDQHAYLDVDAADPLAVGDLVAVGISHPCTTFDKWRAIPIVDASYRVVEVATTCF